MTYHFSKILQLSMDAAVAKVTQALKQKQDFRFAIDFGAGIPVLHGDEAPR